MQTLFINIKGLLQIRALNELKVSGDAMKFLPSISNAFLLIENERILDFGTMDFCPQNIANIVDCSGKFVLPTWCDSHTHIVYAGNREQEFVDRINGLTYEEIATKGGGILNSAALLNETSGDSLYFQSVKRLQEAMEQGTGAIEIKSGYGLSLNGELKMLRTIQRMAKNFKLPIKATFLGAHAFPKLYKNNPEAYIDLLINELLPQIETEKLANFIDVFCETGYFSVAQTQQIIQAGKKHGLTPKIHINQFTSLNGIEMCVHEQALSVDHLEVFTAADLVALQDSETMPVALPTCSYFLSIPYTPARKIIDAGLPLALASDFNPGSSPSGNMNFVVATACIKLKLTPEEAINAATLNGAFAMNLSTEVGSITRGKLANFIITKPLHSFYEIPYSFGSNPIEKVYIAGEIVK